MFRYAEPWRHLVELLAGLCSSSVIDRFKQIEPKVLFAVDGYQYNGNTFDRRPIIAELQNLLPTLQKTANALRRATQHSFP